MEIGKRSTLQTPTARQPETTRAPQNFPPASQSAPEQKPRKRMKMWLIGLVLLVIVTVAAFCVWHVSKKTDLVGIDSNKYQAVFLTNGQVYFGKLSDSSKFQIKIANIYYLQVQQNVQPADKDAKDSQVSLAKLGQELHGPEDTMYIAKDQMLFWENLTDNSKVVQAIKSAKQ